MSSEGGPAGCTCDSEAIQRSLIGITNRGARGLDRSIAGSTKPGKRLDSAFKKNAGSKTKGFAWNPIWW
jgi:hypothetical protein